MEHIINHYYSLYPDNIKKVNHNYSFKIDDVYYLFQVYDLDPKDLNNIYEISNYLNMNNILVHNIIANNKNELLTYSDDIPYILLKININPYKPLSLGEIVFLSNQHINMKNNNRNNNWLDLWEERNDYLEYQISHIGKKYPILVESFNYFIGMAENAISYIRNAMTEKSNNNDETVLSHRRLNGKIESLYNPTNIIFDNRVRDLAEYIKLSFFTNNKNIFRELDTYFRTNHLSEYNVRLLYGRVIYPSFYFELYEDIVSNRKEEKELAGLVAGIYDYEKYLVDIFIFLRKYYMIPGIDWLIKKQGTNPR